MSFAVGKTAIFSEFYTGNYGSVFRFVRGMMRSGSEAEDIAQESFFRLYKHWSSMESDDHARAWIFSVARNLSVDRLKSRSRLSGALSDIYASEGFLLDEITLWESLRMLEAAIAQLPAQTRRVVSLTYEGRSNAEIVSEMELSINTVKTLKKEAYKKLRAILGAKCTLLLAFLLIG